MRLIALLLATIACVAITAADSAHHNPNAALPSNNDIPRVDVTPTTPPTLHPEGKAIQPDAMKKPLVLVLGSAGFIGTYLVQRLEAEVHNFGFAIFMFTFLACPIILLLVRLFAKYPYLSSYLFLPFHLVFDMQSLPNYRITLCCMFVIVVMLIYVSQDH